MPANSGRRRLRSVEVQNPRHSGSESVETLERRDGHFPHLFLWQGREYQVQAVERCWTICRREQGNRVEGYCFRLRCQEGTFDLFEDARAGTWHMRRRVR